MARRSKRLACGAILSSGTVPTIVPASRQNRASGANSSQAVRSEKVKKRKDLRGNRGWTRGEFPFSKLPYAALWKSSIWRIQLVSGFPLGHHPSLALRASYGWQAIRSEFHVQAKDGVLRSAKEDWPTSVNCS